MSDHHHDISPERKASLQAILHAMPGNDAETQRQRLLRTMQTHQSVSTFECSRCLDIYYPPARKRELILMGHPVKLTWRDVITEAGERHRVGVYFLERG